MPILKNLLAPMQHNIILTISAAVLLQGCSAGTDDVAVNTSSVPVSSLSSSSSSSSVKSQLSSSSRSMEPVSSQPIVSSASAGSSSSVDDDFSAGTGVNLAHTPCIGGNGVPSNIKQIFIRAYQDEFGLTVPEPACARRGSDTLRNVTSTLYHPDGTLYRIYWLPDGTLEARQSRRYASAKPRGTYRMAVLSIDYHTTNAAEVFPEAFIAAGNKVNSYFSDYSTRAGLHDNILTYEMEHFLVPREFTAMGANDKALETFEPYLNLQGFSVEDFDAFLVLDIDEGKPLDNYYGWCCFSQHRLAWGTYSRGENITASTGSGRVALDGAFFVGFVHEMGHWHGWEHEWAGATAPDYLITAPELYGWTDVDGDGVVEIWDETPYGMTP